MARLEIDIAANIESLIKSLSNAESGLQKFASKALVIGTAMSAAITLPLVALGRASVQSFAEIENGLREVNTLFGLTGEASEKNLGDLKKIAGEASRELGILQNKVVPGLYNAISAGVPKDNALEFIKVAGRAAIAGVTDINTSVDGLTSILNAFNKDFSETEAVSDSVFAAIQGGKTTFEELSASIFNIAPAAAAAKVTIQEVNAAIATLTASGTPTTVATTQLRAALTGLQRPSQELTKIFNALGFENAQAAIESKGLVFALNAVKTATGGNNGKLQELLGSVEAVAAANVLAGNGAGKFADEMIRQANAAGASKIAFEEADKSFSRQIERTGVLINNIGIGIGESIAPALLSFNNAIKSIAEAFDSLSDGSKQTIVVIAGIAAAIGPLLIAVGTAIKLLPILTSGFVTLKAVVIAATGPFGLIAIAVAAAIPLLFELNSELQRTSKIAGEVKADLLAKKIQETNKFLDEQVLKYRELLPELTEEERINKILVFELQQIRKIRGQSTEAIKAQEDALFKWGLEALSAAKKATNLGDSVKLTFEAFSKLADIKNEEVFNKWTEGADGLNKELEESISFANRLEKALNNLGNIKPKKTTKSKKEEGKPQEFQLSEDVLIDRLNKIETPILEGPPVVEIPEIDESKKTEFIKSLEDFSTQASGIVSYGITNAFAGMGEAIGAALANGTSVVKAVGGALLGAIGNIATELGKAAIAIGVGMIAIKAAFKNPFTAIAAGIALVALGSFISSKVPKMTGGGGGVSSSGIGAQNYGGRGADIDDQSRYSNVRFEIEGTKLIGLIDRTQDKYSKG